MLLFFQQTITCQNVKIKSKTIFVEILLSLMSSVSFPPKFVPPVDNETKIFAQFSRFQKCQQTSLMNGICFCFEKIPKLKVQRLKC